MAASIHGLGGADIGQLDQLLSRGQILAVGGTQAAQLKNGALVHQDHLSGCIWLTCVD